MKNLRLLVGLTSLGFAVAVGCGDDTSNTSAPGAGGDGAGSPTSGAGKSNSAGTKATAGSATNPEGGVPSGGAPSGGAPPTAGTPAGGAPGGAGPTGPVCGVGPACDDATQKCVAGTCLLLDGQTCAANADCVHTCIGKTCATRADVLETCDFGVGGAGGAGSGGGGAGGLGAGGAPPEEMGNGDDADCLDGLACDSGTCKRKAGTDCTGPEQCLSNICHKSKCTPVYKGTCTANACAAPVNNLCGLTTTATNDCSFNYIPNSGCTADFKITTCFESCACQLAP